MGFFQSSLLAQTSSFQVDRSYNGLSLTEFIKRTEQKEGLHFFYQKDSLPAMNMIVEQDSMELEKVLTNNLQPYNFFITVDQHGNVFLNKDKRIEPQLPAGFFSAKEINTMDQDSLDTSENYLVTRKEIGLKTLYVGSKKKGAYKEDATMSGYLTGGSKGQKVIGATLYFEELKSGVVSDMDGFYSIQLKKGKYTLSIRSLEYEEKKFHLVVYSDAQINFSLDEKVSALKEVVIVAEGANNLKTTTMGAERITSKSIKMIPKMMGENDIVKTTLLLPGVQSVGEGTAGYNVRGGSADQNVFYINQIPVYNTSHLMGFFSAFTPNAISELTLYKGSFPAQFGGHLSSVFDIGAKEGNNKKFSAEGGISPVTANILAEGPVSKGKSSYLVGVRSTYSDWALKLVNVDAIKNSRARFHDGIVNFTFGLNEKNRLNASGYYSKDHIILASLTDYDYQNAGGALKWNHFFKQKHNFEFSTIYSTYGYNERNSASTIRGYQTNYSLNHLEARTSLSLVPNDYHRINIGANSVLYQLDQGSYRPLNEESLVIPIQLKKEQGLESGVFINEEWKPSPVFSLSAGVRYNFYTFLGTHDSYIYKEGQPLEIDNIIDTVYYGKNKKVKSYSAPDLRLSAKYAINEFMSIKAAFNQVHQYIFMLSNTIAVAPTDKWKLVDEHIKP
ncbi:MAG TPA: TonB-dependent receptor, partial [Bacteroidia bacterium]|nr:TonB-dependent receptor [Bacteroidia bacterium]